MAGVPESMQRVVPFADGPPQCSPWVRISPNAAGDWVNQRDSDYELYRPLGDKDEPGRTMVRLFSLGLLTSRDPWVYNFDRRALVRNVDAMIGAYNAQVDAFGDYMTRYPGRRAVDLVEEFIDRDPRRISWARGLKQRLARGHRAGPFNPGHVVAGDYRPFCRQWVYFSSDVNETVSQQRRIFPEGCADNIAITVTGVGARREFSALMAGALPNYHFQDSCQTFPRYVYDREPEDTLLAGDGGGVRRTHSITDATLADFRVSLGDPKITKDDIFFHIYGVLHHPTYRERYAAELRKMLPRLPMVADFHAYAAAGRALSDLHVGYESVDPYPLEEIATGPASLPDAERYRVQKMRFPTKGDRGTIVYNAHVRLAGIPERAYDYAVNGRPAIEWIIDRYQVRTDRDSGIVNDPNAYPDDPRYIVDLLRRIVTVSLRTLDIVDQLPAFEVVT